MRSALLFAALAASALAGPTGQRETCALHCTQDNIFSYQQGRSYEYQYSASTSTALLGTLQDEARLRITAHAHIDVTAPCEYTLRLTQVTLDGSSHAPDFAAALTKSSLRFSFQDGRVESLCAAPTEEPWVLNFKRGLLSAFQSSVTRPGTQEVQETDVSGVCLTRYENLVEGDVLTVERVKEVSSCTQRPDLTSHFASTAYVTDSAVQSLPVFDSTNKCSQKVEGGILTSAECKETHKFRPFSGEEGGAITTAMTSLMLVGRDALALPATDLPFTRKSPVFEATDATAPQGQLEAVHSLLAELEEAAHEDVRPQVPVLFSKLVAALRTLDYPALSTIYAATEETHSRRFLVDAMPLAGTAAAAGVVRDMHTNGDLTEEEADAWFTSLTFLKNPTSEMFTAIAPMLENNPSQKAMLGTSALVNTFCKINADCGEDSGVLQVLRRIEAQLGSGCRALDQDQKTKILVALKALGNAGRWLNAERVLQRCYTEDNDMEVRVAAIEAWRHTPCEYDRSHLLAAFQDEAQDSEVRIAAYLAVMTCPTPAVVATIKDRLTSEGVNQVGSFVWTHMTNLQESAAPGKEWVRHLIGEELLANKFRTEALKFSRNYESSFFMKELNAGAAVESNVVFSSKSYLPRSAMLNLTLDLFGESINLFEVGGRIEGFETYLERLFGPSGYFPEETVEGILTNLRHNKPDPEATTLEHFLEQATDQPSASYYLRLFGNDVYYRKIHDLTGAAGGASSPLHLLTELIRNGHVDHTKSFQLLDSQYSVPTVAGLPLTLGAKGTATVALRLDGNFQAQSFSNVHIEGQVRPSAAVQVDGVMLVDAHVTRVGLKVASTLHTSTYLDGKVQIRGGQLVDIALNTPKDKMEVIDVDTKFFYLEDDKEVEQEVEGRVEHKSCTSGVTGMAVCGELAFLPSSCFPTTVRAFLRKTDTQTGYVIRFTKDRNQLTFLIDTPQSQVPRKISLDLQKQDNKIQINLNSFVTSLEASGEYTWSRRNKHLKLDATVGGRDRFTLDTGLKTSGDAVWKAEPFLVLSSPGGDLANIRATVLVNPAEAKYSADATVNLSPYVPSPIALRASYEGATTAGQVELEMTSPMLNFFFSSQVGYDATFVSTEVNVRYSTPWQDKQSLHSALLCRRENGDDVNTYSLKFELTPFGSTRPMELDYSFAVSSERVETRAKFVYDFFVVTAEEDWSHTYENGVRKINARVAINCPYYDFDRLTTHELTLGPNNINWKSMVSQNDSDEYSIILDLAKNPGRDLTGRFEIRSIDFFFSINASATKVNPGHYTAQVTQTLRSSIDGEESTMSAQGTIKDNSMPGKFNLSAVGSYSSPNNVATLNSEVYADTQGAKVDFHTKVNEKVYRMKMEGTRTSLSLDANIIKDIRVDAQINQDGLGRSLAVIVAWDPEVSSNSLKIEGKILPNEIEAHFKFLEEEFSTSIKQVENGMEMETTWSPEQRVAAALHYSLSDTSSLTTTLETSFPGWEKQEAAISVSLLERKVSGRVSAGWGNNRHATLSVSGEVQPAAGAVHAEISLSSTFADFERISLNLDHEMTGAALFTKATGTWNDRQIDGTLQLTPSAGGLDGRASFTSPFTLPFLATLHHQLLADTLTTSLEANCGDTQLASFTLEGRLSLASGHHDVSLVAKAATALVEVPEAEANIKYSLEGTALALAVDGKVGQRKMMLNVNGKKTVRDGSTAVSGDLRFLTPFTPPLTASLSHTHDGQHFISQFEMTRIWSTYSPSSLKLHAEGHVISKQDINFSAYVSSPDTKGSFSFIHKISNNNMTSVAKFYANGQLISASLNGSLDSTARLIDLEGNISSSFDGLDINVKINSEREGNKQTTMVLLTQGTHSASLDHVLSFTDNLNWENSFTLNNQYSLVNRQSASDTEYGHRMEVRWGEQRVVLDGRFIPSFTHASCRIDAHLKITTPWEYYENNKLDFYFEREGREIKSSLELEGEQGRKIILSTRNMYHHEGQLYSEVSLSTPFWKTLGYKLNVTVRPEMSAALNVLYGEDETSVNLAGHLRPGRPNVQVKVTTPHQRYPILVEASYDVTTPEKQAVLVVQNGHMYETKASFSGTVKQANWGLQYTKYIQASEDGPWEAVSDLEVKSEYQIETLPLTFNTVVKVNSSPYEVALRLDDTSFVANMVLDGRAGSLAGKWLFNTSTASVDLKLQSPFDFINNFDVSMICDMNQMKFHSRLNYNSQEAELLAKMEEGTFIFEGKTPFSGWETLNASFFASKTAINAFVSRNDRRIEVTGTQHLKKAKGKLELAITTPYTGLEMISFDTAYNFNGDTKTVKLKSTYGANELSARGVVKVGDLLAPEVTLTIETPFSEVRTLRAHANWRLNNPIKTVEVKMAHNGQEFSWNLEAGSEDGVTQKVTSRINTPIPGWSEVSLEASLAFYEMPYEVKLTYQKEEDIKNFGGKITLSENSFHGGLITPIPGWESVALDGTYTLQQDHLVANARIDKESERYEVNADIQFNTQSPKLILEVKTPLSQAGIIKFEVDTNLVGAQKTCRMVFTNNNVLFSSESTWKVTNNTGFFNLKWRSPIPGYTNLEIQSEFDLTSDIKRANMNLTKEGQTQQFSIIGTVNDNNVVLDVATPFEGFEVMKMNADYSSTGGQHFLTATFVKDHDSYNFRTSMKVQDNSMEIRLSSPIESIKHVVLNGHYETLSSGFQSSIHFERNDDVFSGRTRCLFTPLASSLTTELNTPVANWNKLVTNFKYDITSSRKTAELSTQYNDIHKEISVEAAYNTDQGYVTVRTPFSGLEVLGVEYSLTLDGHNEFNALVKVTQNSQEWNFSAYGQYTNENICIKFQTPFEGYDTTSLEANINVTARTAKANLQFGSHIFSVNVSYALDDMFLEVTTPFPALRFGSVAVKHRVMPNRMDASLTVVRNKDSYFLLGGADVSPRSSGLTLQVKTPISDIQNASFQARYNLDNKNELITAQVTINERSYNFLVAGEVQKQLACLQWELTTPFSGWTQVKFEAKVDASQEDKVLEITLERDGNVKSVSVRGKLIGSGLNFDLRTPFAGLNRVNVSGSLDRAKRSLELQMMNDAGEATILTSFNFVKIHVKTPFVRVGEIELEIEKDGNEYKGHWKRNDNYLELKVVSDPSVRSFNLEVQSELQGWEFLALAGLLDRRRHEAFASGQINEDKMKLHISGGTLPNRRASNYNLNLETPYEKYRIVTGSLQLSPSRKELKIQSSSSDFKVTWKRTRRGIEAELLVPNPTQNTVLNLDFKRDGGTLDFTSRFGLVRSFHFEYTVAVQRGIQVTQNANLNGLEILSMDFNANPATNLLHLDIHGRRTNRHIHLHVHREGLKAFNFLFKREVTDSSGTTDKQLKIDITGSDNLPAYGTLDATFTNTFAEVPRTTKARLEINRGTSPKRVKLEVTFPGNKLYILDVTYNINLRNLNQGDFTIRTTRPTRQSAPWQNISGRWNVENRNQAILELTWGRTTFKAEGKLSLQESDLILTSETVPERIFLQWKFIRRNTFRDYFLKIGPESQYRMLKLKGNIQGISSGNVEAGFKASFQPDEFHFNGSWNLNADGTFTGQGRFNHGEDAGNYNLKFQRNAATRSANFELTASSTEYRRVQLKGEYDVLGKLVFKAKLQVNDAIAVIDIDISDLNPVRSRNSININIPFLPPQYRVFQLRIAHDLRRTNKYIRAEGQIGLRESHLKANWNRSDNFDTLAGKIDIKSIFIGEVAGNIRYDVSNINNAKAEVHYKRTPISGQEVTVDGEWTRKKTNNRLETQVKVNSIHAGLPNLRFYANADYSELFSLDAGIDIDDKQIRLTLNVGRSATVAELTTPIPNFESIKATITYELEDKKQSMTIKYERGTRVVDLSINLNRKTKKKGDLTVNLTTPFEILRNLQIEASWRRGQAQVLYIRNDVVINMKGTVQVDVNKSQFNLSFNMNDGRAVTIAGAYDVEAFIDGTGNSPTTLASLQIDIGETKIKFNMDGYRNSERLFFQLDAETSFNILRKLHLKLDSELNLQSRHGTFELELNDFIFEVHNEFERYDNGYYFKTRIESTLTPLPALVFGLGRKGPERIVTIGYGEEKEITFSVKAKNDFRSGFSGFVDIPNFGYDGVTYDVDYRFENENELLIEIDVQLGPGNQKIEVEINYNSDGVQARLATPFTGSHSIRARRSISADSFFTEVGFDDYNLKLRGGLNDGDIKRGAVLEADIFGREFLFNYQLQSEGQRYSEGKMVLHTPFRGWEKIGGMFSLSVLEQRLNARAELYIPFLLNVQRMAVNVDLDLNNKIEGHATLDVGNQQFSLKSSLQGASLQEGYQGTVQLGTPFHALSNVQVVGKIKTDLLNFEADLKITDPYTTHEIDLSYNLSPDRLTASGILLSESYQGLRVNFLLEGLRTTYNKVNLRVNNDQLVAEYNKEESSFIFNVDTRLAGVPRQLSVETKYPALEDMEATLIAVLGEESHKVQGGLNIANSRVRGEASLESSLIGGERRLDFDIIIPNASYEHVTVSVTLTALQTHSFSLELDTRTGLQVTVKLNTPTFPETTVDLQVMGPRAGVTVTTPTATHKATASWMQTRKMPADQVVTAELETPLLEDPYRLSVLLGGSSSNRLLKIELQQGNVKHLLEAKTFMTSTGGGFSLDVETPFRNIEKAALRGSLNLSDVFELQAGVTMMAIINTFNFKYNKEEGTLLAEVESPFIHTGLMKATAKITQEPRNLQVETELMTAQDMISGRVTVKRPSNRNITVRVMLDTSLEGFKTVDAFFRYERDDYTHIVFSVDHPVTFRVDAKFANSADKLKGNITVKTSVQDFEYIEADLEIPLTKIAPSASLTLPKHKYGFAANYEREEYSQKASGILYLDDESVGGNLSFRSKAPYELAYKYHIPNFNEAFHLRTDSSFFSLLM